MVSGFNSKPAHSALHILVHRQDIFDFEVDLRLNSIKEDPPQNCWHFRWDQRRPNCFESWPMLINKRVKKAIISCLHWKKKKPSEDGFQTQESCCPCLNEIPDRVISSSANNLPSLSLRLLRHLKFHFHISFSQMPASKIVQFFCKERWNNFWNWFFNGAAPCHTSFQKWMERPPISL